MAELLPAHAGMVPCSFVHPPRDAPAPRARGDGPGTGETEWVLTDCSPRTRGWSPRGQLRIGGGQLLPAHAGMVPPGTCSCRWPSAAPRARGDGPGSPKCTPLRRACSPRTRGWSRRHDGDRGRRELLPAHAGMVPVYRLLDSGFAAAPRARGDGPFGPVPRCAQSSCSPRTRGWSLLCTPLYTDTELLPAHAGMVPWLPQRSGRSRAAPRARGDGPVGSAAALGALCCSPRTRGWSRGRDTSRPAELLLPAHAGMVPLTLRTAVMIGTAPRARGDGPSGVGHMAGTLLCSPRTRGWSPGARTYHQTFVLLPAHAGMVPIVLSRRSGRPPAPRARGDGPPPCAARPPCRSCSPRTRGWSRL